MERVLVQEHFLSGSLKTEHYEVNGVKDGFKRATIFRES
jgi:hypothetical protein